jgi:hypothetical protein
MTNTKVSLADGQVWQMTELNLQVGMVGKLLVHYKLAKPNAVRVPNLVGSIATIQKFLKKNKAVLVGAIPAPVEKLKPSVAKKASAAVKRSVVSTKKR